MDPENSEDLYFEEPTLETTNGNRELFVYLKKARELLQKYYELLEKPDWWVEYDSDGVTLWTRTHEENSFNYCKRYMEVNVKIDELVKLIRDSSTIKRTDDRIKEYDYCYNYDSSSNILKIKIEGNFIVSDRAIICFETVQKLPNECYAQIMFSIDTDKVEVDSSCVLADCTIYVAIIEEVSENSCKMTDIFHNDPNGSIPAIIANRFFKDRHTEWVKFKEIIEDM